MINELITWEMAGLMILGSHFCLPLICASPFNIEVAGLDFSSVLFQMWLITRGHSIFMYFSYLMTAESKTLQSVCFVFLSLSLQGRTSVRNMTRLPEFHKLKLQNDSYLETVRAHLTR